MRYGKLISYLFPVLFSVFCTEGCSKSKGEEIMTKKKSIKHKIIQEFIKGSSGKFICVALVAFFFAVLIQEERFRDKINDYKKTVKQNEILIEEQEAGSSFSP